MMTIIRYPWGGGVDISREPIGHEFKTCIARAFYQHPGSRIIRHGEVLYLHSGRFEFRCDHLCAAKPPTPR